MWYVYDREDNWEQGWIVNSREEAERQCAENSSLSMLYVG